MNIVKWYDVKGHEENGSFRVVSHDSGYFTLINDLNQRVTVKEDKMILATKKRKPKVLPKDMLQDTDQMTFGAHKGKPIGDVPDQYLLWLSEQSWVTGKLKNYLVENIDAIKANIKRGGRK